MVATVTAPAPAAEEPTRRQRLLDRAGDIDWRAGVGGPIAIYAATRLGQLAFLAWLSPPGGASLYARLLSWDSGWFIRVASQGYPHGYTYDGAGLMTANGLAFFPLYPALIRAVHTLGPSYGGAALTVSTTAGALAAIALYALVRRLVADGRLGIDPAYARRAGWAFVVLFCAQPMSVTLSMGYSESVFVTLVAAMLLAAYRRAWLTAGVLGVAAGLTRPTGAAAALALAVAAITCLADRHASLRTRMSAMVAALAGLAAVPAYILWVGLRVGDPMAWFRIQTAGWGTTFDYGESTGEFVEGALRTATGWISVSVALLLVAATAAIVVAVRRRGWLPLTVYGLISFVLVVGQAGYYHSKPRLLVPVLLLLVPAALAAAGARPRAAVLWLSAYAAVGLWYGAYMITVWPYAI